MGLGVDEDSAEMCGVSAGYNIMMAWARGPGYPSTCRITCEAAAARCQSPGVGR